MVKLLPQQVSQRVQVMSTLTLLMCLLVLALLAGCQQAVHKPPPGEWAPLAIAPSARLYKLRPEESGMQVYVYREGRLAELGHNHVVSSADLHGEVYVADTAGASALEIRLPVSGMEVDNPQLRAAAGEDFPGVLEQDAIDGTRSNMLGERQLDGVLWPEIILRSRKIRGELPELFIDMEVAVRGQVHALTVPVRVVLTADQLVATGQFSVNQTDLGLVPFSVMLGALRVRDQLDIAFHLVAAARNLEPQP